MASKRMFAKSVINSAKFLKMPSSTQLLYFHLGCNADDDGVVEAFNIMKLCSATEDDLKVLVLKQYVVILNDELVSFITDWRTHNDLRADRKIDTFYKELLLQIIPNVELLERKERSDRKGKKVGRPEDGQWTTNGQLSLGEVSLVQGSLVQDSLSESSGNFQPPTLEEIQLFIEKEKINIDAVHFLYYYKMQGWHLNNGNKMEDWRCAVRNWKKRDKEFGSSDSKKNGRNEIVPENMQPGYVAPEQLKHEWYGLSEEEKQKELEKLLKGENVGEPPNVTIKVCS